MFNALSCESDVSHAKDTWSKGFGPGPRGDLILWLTIETCRCGIGVADEDDLCGNTEDIFSLGSAGSEARDARTIFTPTFGRLTFNLVPSFDGILVTALDVPCRF